MPYGQHVRMEPHVTLAAEGRVPHVCIALAIGAGTASYDLFMILRYEEPSVLSHHDAAEELLVREIKGLVNLLLLRKKI